MLLPDETDISDQTMIGVAYFMNEDDFLESDYEDKYTIQGDWDSEDESYFEDIDDFHYDSPSLQDTWGEMPSYGN